MKSGVCKLCLKASELCDSHVVPKWASKRLRENDSSNPNPVVFRQGRAAQVSYQVTEYLLCLDCEQHIGRFDDYASEICGRIDGGIPLLERMIHPPIASGNLIRESRIRLHATTDLNIDGLTRFAYSVVWRADAARLPHGSRLGPYAESFRENLLHARPLENVELLVGVIDPASEVSEGFRMISMPTEAKHGAVRSHRFTICGLLLDVMVGRNLRGAEHWSFPRTGRVAIVPAHLSGLLRGIVNAAWEADESRGLLRSRSGR